MGVASFLWTTTFFSLYFYQAMAAFDCKEQWELNENGCFPGMLRINQGTSRTFRQDNRLHGIFSIDVIHKDPGEFIRDVANSPGHLEDISPG